MRLAAQRLDLCGLRVEDELEPRDHGVHREREPLQLGHARPRAR
jgi:hypothetical protein